MIFISQKIVTCQLCHQSFWLVKFLEELKVCGRPQTLSSAHLCYIIASLLCVNTSAAAGGSVVGRGWDFWPAGTAANCSSVTSLLQIVTSLPCWMPSRSKLQSLWPPNNPCPSPCMHQLIAEISLKK